MDSERSGKTIMDKVREQAALGAQQELQDGQLLDVPLELLDPNPFQPRLVMDPQKVQELADSIAQNGLLQPIAVRPREGRFVVVGGHRRKAAFERLREQATTDAGRRRYSTIRAIVMLALDDATMAVDAFVENGQREPLNPLEECAALVRIKALLEQTSRSEVTVRDVAARVAYAPKRVERLLLLDTAPACVKNAVTGALAVPGIQKEYRRLELLGAVAFVRLHKHFTRDADSPATLRRAEERTEAHVKRALAEAWGLRRIEDHVKAIVAGRAKPDAELPPAAVPGPAPLLRRDGVTLTVALGRMEDAPLAELLAAADELEKLAAQARARAARMDDAQARVSADARGA